MSANKPRIHAHEIEMLYAGSLAAQKRFAEARALLSAGAAQSLELGERYAAPRRVIATALAGLDDRTSD